MRKLNKITCKTCKKSFLTKNNKKIFCTRKCFKKNYYHRKKAEELSNIKFPVFLCPNCGKKIELNFDPVKDHRKWTKFSCPNCNVLMINVCEEIVVKDVPTV